MYLREPLLLTRRVEGIPDRRDLVGERPAAAGAEDGVVGEGLVLTGGESRQAFAGTIVEDFTVREKLEDLVGLSRSP